MNLLPKSFVNDDGHTFDTNRTDSNDLGTSGIQHYRCNCRGLKCPATASIAVNRNVQQPTVYLHNHSASCRSELPFQEGEDVCVQACRVFNRFVGTTRTKKWFKSVFGYRLNKKDSNYLKTLLENAAVARQFVRIQDSVRNMCGWIEQQHRQM